MVACRTPLLGTWPATQACALTGNWTGDPLVHRPRTQSTEAHQPGLKIFFKLKFFQEYRDRNTNWFFLTADFPGNRSELGYMTLRDLFNSEDFKDLSPPPLGPCSCGSQSRFLWALFSFLLSNSESPELKLIRPAYLEMKTLWS